jgi:uncharacterized membrane protein
MIVFCYGVISTHLTRFSGYLLKNMKTVTCTNHLIYKNINFDTACLKM